MEISRLHLEQSSVLRPTVSASWADIMGENIDATTRITLHTQFEQLFNKHIAS